MTYLNMFRSEVLKVLKFSIYFASSFLISIKRMTQCSTYKCHTLNSRAHSIELNEPIFVASKIQFSDNEMRGKRTKTLINDE